MEVLPWLLNWPPRRGTVAVFLLLTTFSVGTLALFGGVTDEIRTDNVTVDATDLTVRLNDELTIPDTNGSVRTCMASGTPGDSVSVTGDVTVDSPSGRGGSQLTLVVSLAHTGETTSQRVERGRRDSTRLLWVFEDDETLSVGENATVQMRVRTDDETVANATKTVPVEKGTRRYDC